MLPNLADREKLLNLEGVEDIGPAKDEEGDPPGPDEDAAEE